MMAVPQTAGVHTLILYGNCGGYLAPCGCTSPMSGGIVRAGKVIKELSASGDSHLLLLGGYVAGAGRQDQLKAEALGEFARTVRAAGMEFSSDVAALGPGELLELDQLSAHAVFSSSVSDTPSQDLKPTVNAGPFLVGSVTRSPDRFAGAVQGRPVRTEMAIANLLDEAKAEGRLPVLVTDEDEAGAVELAEKHPDLAVVVYRSTTAPPKELRKVGGVVLATTGFRGKAVVSLSYDGNNLRSYDVEDLGPDVPNDKETSEVYDGYLRRVQKENLLAQWPRSPSASFAGSGACAPCHATAYKTWSHSGHARAYRDLETQGHGADPDCVSCHVVGLSSQRGFYSQAKTPQLASVGCESCHGPGRAHALSPRRVSLIKASFKTCAGCHTLDNSPGFNVKEYWPQIYH